MVVVDSLLGTAQVTLGLECLGSLLRAVPEARLRLRDDGTLTDQDRDRLSQALEEPEFVSRPLADEQVELFLARYPASLAYRRSHPLGLKLFDVVLGQVGRLHFCDSDVLFLRPVGGLFEVAALGEAVFLKDVQNAYSLRSWQILKHGLRIPARINTGLFTYPREAFDLDLVEWYLARLEMGFAPVWREQTAWALLAGRLRSSVFDPALFRIATGPPLAEDPRSPPAALHFVTPARGYLVPWRELSGPAARARSEECSMLSALGLLRDEAERVRRRLLS